MAPRPVSQPASWALRLAVFVLPFLAIAVLGHRTGAVSTQEAFWLLAMAAAMLVLALILAATGLQQLWTRGAKGGLRSLLAIALAGLTLLPFAWYGAKAFTLPALSDVSTDWADPPELAASLDDRGDAVDPPPATPTQQAEQLKAYPTLVTRRYAIDVDRVFKAVASVVDDRDWVILDQQSGSGVTGVDVQGSSDGAEPTRTAEGRPARAVAPTFRPQDAAPSTDDLGMIAPLPADDETDERFVEAVATSFLFGFESDVVVRLLEEGEETLVDIRVVSRFGTHDLGANASIATEFLEDLDAALQGVTAGG